MATFLYRRDDESEQFIEQTLTIEHFDNLLSLLQRAVAEEAAARTLRPWEDHLSDDLLTEIEATLAITRAETNSYSFKSGI